MKTISVKLECGIAGDLASHGPGDVIEVPADRAKRMIAAGQAVEFAAIAAPENTAVRTTAPAARRTKAHVPA